MKVKRGYVKIEIDMEEADLLRNARYLLEEMQDALMENDVDECNSFSCDVDEAFERLDSLIRYFEDEDLCVEVK